MTAVAVLVRRRLLPRRRPISFARMVQRVSKQYGKQTAIAWTTAVLRHQKSISEAALRSAIASGNIKNIEAVVGTGQLSQTIQKQMVPPFTKASQTAGAGSAAILKANGLAASFNAVHPNVVNFARAQSAELVVGISAETKQMIAEVIAIGAEQGLTVVQQARAIREVVGLPPPWATAPVNLAQEIRTGQAAAATSRRLSARAKQEIRSRIAGGTVTDAFIADMATQYTASLINRRALNIARTESIRAAHNGLNESWKQAQSEGVLPEGSRRYWLVTPDDRLSPEHARIPGMNPNGRAIDEPFETPDGRFMYPPSRPNCRCSLGLLPFGGSIADEDGEIVQPGEAVEEPLDASDEELLQLPSSAFPQMREGVETVERYYANGTFTPERQRLHDAIVRQHFRDVRPVGAGMQPEVKVMGGGPASGKSVMIDRIPAPNHVVIDPDKIKTLLPEFREGVALGDVGIGTITHEESSLIGKRIVEEATRGRYNILIDGSGDNSFENIASKVAQYRAQGARVVANYVTVDTDVAVARAFARGKKVGRFVPETYLREMHKNISSIVPRAMSEGLFDELVLWDTNAKEVKAIAKAVGKRITVLDEPAWQRFLAKAQADQPLLNNAFPLVGTRRADVILGGWNLPGERVHQYLGAYGREWKAAPLPPGIRKMPPKMCYENASKLVLEHPNWRYVEGIAYSSETGDLAFAHAWAVTPEGFVVDATWGNPAKARYFGVAYDRSAYLTHVTKNKFYGVLGGDADDAARALATGAKKLRQQRAVKPRHGRGRGRIEPGLIELPPPLTPVEKEAEALYNIKFRSRTNRPPWEEAPDDLRRLYLKQAQKNIDEDTLGTQPLRFRQYEERKKLRLRQEQQNVEERTRRIEEERRLKQLTPEERLKEIARQNGVAEDRVTLSRSAVPPDIIVGGRNLGKQGGYYNPRTGRVVIERNGVRDQGLMAHEIQHLKFDAVIKRYDIELATLRAAERAGEAVTFADGLLRPEILRRFPMVARLQRYFEGYYTRGDRLAGRFVSGRDLLIKEDGVSAYSREYYEAWKAGTLAHHNPFRNWINETLAEMARSERIGDLTRKGFISHGSRWRTKKHLLGLYDEINAAYADNFGTRRTAKRLRKPRKLRNPAGGETT